MSKPHTHSQLESILRRKDVWRGDSTRFNSQRGIDSGYTILNKALLHKGWPTGSLIEICQPFIYGYAEWHLLQPSLRHVNSGYIVLLNPPALPFAHGLIQAGLDINKLIIVQSNSKTDFVKSFVELAHTESCHSLLAWQPKQQLSYTELRKCLLAIDSHKLAILFRHSQAAQQSSPAALRILSTLSAHGLKLEIFKQKGVLNKKNQHIQLPLPAAIHRIQTWHKEESRPKAHVVSLFESK